MSSEVHTTRSRWRLRFPARLPGVTGYRLREIAGYFGVHYATISRWLRRVERGVGRHRPPSGCCNARPLLHLYRP